MASGTGDRIVKVLGLFAGGRGVPHLGRDHRGSVTIEAPRFIRTVLGGLVIATVLAACQEGPGGVTQRDSNNITRTFTLRASQFTLTDIDAPGDIGVVGFAVTEFSFPEITSKVVGEGLFHAYIQTPGDDSWTTLPFSMTAGTFSPITLDVSYGYIVGKVALSIYSNVSASAMRPALPAVNGWKLRVVVDP